MTKETLDARKTDFSDLNIFDVPHYGWMAPDGSFYYTTSMEHLSFARETAKFVYREDNGDECLYATGWLAVHPFGVCEDYLFTWRGHLTEEQKRVVKPFVEKWGDSVANLTKRDLFEELELDYPNKDRHYAGEYIERL